MALEVEIWQESIQEKLLQDNTFLNHISNVSGDNVINGKIVHIPQAGDPSKVVKKTTDQNPNPTAVNFSTQGQDGKALGGSYSANGGFNLNGNNITKVEDLEIIQLAFATILEIINHKNQ